MKQITKDVIWQHAMLIMFFLASVAIVTIVISTKYKILPEYIVPIGQALLGSAIVGFVIDQSVRHKFLKEIGREVFGFIVGQYYPKEASEYINRFIKEGIILRNFVRRYTFVALDDRQVKIEVRIDYQVGNYGVAEEIYAPKLQIKERDLPEIIGLTCGLSGDKSTHFKGERLKPMPGRDGVRIVEGQRVKLKPIGINHSQLYNVTWHFTLTKAITDDDIISFGRTTIGVEIQAHFNPQELRVEIDCDEFGVEQLDEFTWKAPNKHALFVERQHIEIKWKPIKQNA